MKHLIYLSIIIILISCKKYSNDFDLKLNYLNNQNKFKILDSLVNQYPYPMIFHFHPGYLKLQIFKGEDGMWSLKKINSKEEKAIETLLKDLNIYKLYTYETKNIIKFTGKYRVSSYSLIIIKNSAKLNEEYKIEHIFNDSIYLIK